LKKTLFQCNAIIKKWKMYIDRNCYNVTSIKWLESGIFFTRGAFQQTLGLISAAKNHWISLRYETVCKIRFKTVDYCKR